MATLPNSGISKNAIQLSTIGESEKTKREIKQPETASEENIFAVIKHPTSYIETLIHFIKGSTGSGIFAMSHGFKNAGILLAPIITMICGLSCLYGEHLLLRSATHLKEKLVMRQYPAFAETVELGFEHGPECFQRFSKYMKPLVNICIITTHLGFCCVYIIFISSTSEQLLMELYGIEWNIRVHMAIFTIPIILFAMIKELKFLVPLSLLANLCFAFGIIAIVYLIGTDLPPVSSRPYVGDWKKIPLFYGTVMYSFEGIGLVLPLKSEMKEPKHFDSPLGVLNIGFFLVMTIDTLFGFFGYLKYGEDIKPSITLSLDPKSQLGISVKTAIAFGILVTYLLMFYVAMVTIWPVFYKKFGPYKHRSTAERLLRIFFVLLTLTLAEVIPQLGLFISLIGACSTTALAMVIPPLCDISLRWPSNFGTCKWRLVLDIITLLLAMFGFLTGTYFSLEAIVEAFFK